MCFQSVPLIFLSSVFARDHCTFPFSCPQGVSWTPSKMIHRLGKEINNPESVCYWAYKVSTGQGSLKSKCLRLLFKSFSEWVFTKQ